MGGSGGQRARNGHREKTITLMKQMNDLMLLKQRERVKEVRTYYERIVDLWSAIEQMNYSFEN